MPEIKTEERAAMRQRCDAATPGPWIKDAHKDTDRFTWVSGDNRGVSICIAGTAGRMTIVDAEFVAAARTDLPRALDEIDRLEASEAAGISIFNEAVEALKGKTAEINLLRRERDYWKERTRVYTEAAASVGVAFASDGTADNLEAGRLEAELAASLDALMTFAERPTCGADDTIGLDTPHQVFVTNRMILTARRLIDTARKEPRPDKCP